MKDKLYTALVAVAVVIVSVSASTLTVDRLTDHTYEQFRELVKLDLRIKAQEKDLEKTETDLKNQSIEIESQNKSLRIARTKIDALLEEATGLEGQDASKRLEQVKVLADAIGSSDNLNLLLGLQSRVDALTNSDLMACSETIEYGRAQSCREHNDWIPRASCPPGRFIRSINIVARQVTDGWACGFRLECCSNVGIPPSAQATD